MFLSNLYLAACLAATAIKSSASYFIYGPRCPKWSLKFQVRRDVIHRFIKPNDSDAARANELTEADIQEMVRSRAKRVVLGEATLMPELGVLRASSIRVENVQIDSSLFAGAGVAESGLACLAMADKTELGRQREIPCETIVPHSVIEALREPGIDKEKAFGCSPLYPNERIVLYLHGGAYIFGSPASHRNIVGNISSASGLRSIAIDYRLAPLHPFPAQLHDAYIAFSYLVQQGFDPQDIILGGDSAGGNLALVLMHLLRHIGISNIRGLVLLSPWVDLVHQGKPSVTKNAPYDYLRCVDVKHPRCLSRLFYAPGRKYSEELVEEMSSHLVSPVNGDYTDFPPTLLQAGEKELMVDYIAQLYGNIIAANPDSKEQYRYESYTDMIHVFQFFDDVPDTSVAYANIGRFIKNL
ncbi:hypothetical protein GGI12_003061 [Dipsacomyces acuminosporus]|nr:hypothetical protein GGI12_003061 [Dipsacomyces acuminosporus]